MAEEELAGAQVSRKGDRGLGVPDTFQTLTESEDVDFGLPARGDQQGDQAYGPGLTPRHLSRGGVEQADLAAQLRSPHRHDLRPAIGARCAIPLGQTSQGRRLSDLT